jgi:UDP-4-amino-4,6-dideoxy-N-acetyl-beta-L-altrosamine transaminase
LTLDFLPYGRQAIDDDDVVAVSAALRRDLITQGPTIEEFERAFADHVEAAHAVAFANGTAALHGAAAAAGVGQGDDVITTPLSFVASSNCVLYHGGRPRFIDVDPATWNLDTGAAARAVSDATRAIVAVSLTGLPVDLEPLRELRDTVTVIEDASHALGAVRFGARVGGSGGADMTTFSLHPVKSITTGEGGIVTTESQELADNLRRFRSHGISRDPARRTELDGDWYYDVEELGFNYRITDFQAALGVSQLRHLEDWVQARNQIADWYRELLGDESRIALPPAAPDGSRHAYHLFVIRILEGAQRRLSVFQGLRAARIGVQLHYIPIYRFSYYRDTLGYPQDQWPATEEYYAGAISLPMFPALTRPGVERVVADLRRLLA